MLNITEARHQAAMHTLNKGEKWIVMETSADAPSNQHPANIHNTGPFIAVPRDEALAYAAGGCRIADLMI